MRYSEPRIRIALAATAILCAFICGCLPDTSTPAAPNTVADVRTGLDLSSPQSTFETMVSALESNDHMVRMACLTKEAQHREAGVMALNLMDIALKAPIGGDKYLTLLKDHGLTQVYVNQAMATYGADPANMPIFTERLGAKIKDLPKFHYEVSKMVPRPPLPSLEFVSANEENERMIGRIKVDDKDAIMLFRQVDEYWLIDGETK